MDVWAVRVSQVTQWVKNSPAMQEVQVQSLGWEDPLEEDMATHSSILAWRIPWTEEPGGLQSIGSWRVEHDWNDLVHTHLKLCDQTSTFVGSCRKQRSFRKTSGLLTMPKPLTVWTTKNSGKFVKRWEYLTTSPASWEICMQVRKQQLELDMDNRLVPNREQSMSRLYTVTLLI